VTEGPNLKGAGSRMHAEDVFLGFAQMSRHQPIRPARKGRGWPRGGRAHRWASMRPACRRRRSGGGRTATDYSESARCSASTPSVPAASPCLATTGGSRSCQNTLPPLTPVSAGRPGDPRGDRSWTTRGFAAFLLSTSFHREPEPGGLGKSRVPPGVERPTPQSSFQLVTRHGVSGKSSTK
jgi:hypothetical protein